MMPMEAIPTHRTNLDASGVTAAPAPDIIPEHVRHPLVATLPAGLAAGKSADAGAGQSGPSKIASATRTALAPTMPWSCPLTTAACCAPTRPSVAALRNGTLQLRGDRPLGEVDHLRTVRAVYRAPDLGDQAVADEDPSVPEIPGDAVEHGAAH
jgi:hypothetical protein